MLYTAWRFRQTQMSSALLEMPCARGDAAVSDASTCPPGRGLPLASMAPTDKCMQVRPPTDTQLAERVWNVSTGPACRRPVAEAGAELRQQFVEAGFTPEEPAFSQVVRAIAQSDQTD